MRENTNIYLAHLLQEHHGENWPPEVLKTSVKDLLDTIKKYNDVPANNRLYHDLEQFIQQYLIA